MDWDCEHSVQLEKQWKQMKDAHLYLYLYLFLTAVGSVVSAADVNGHFLGGESDKK